MEAVLEELNADVKLWMAGDGESDRWQRIIRNFEKLKDLREKVWHDCIAVCYGDCGMIMIISGCDCTLSFLMSEWLYIDYVLFWFFSL